MLDSFTSWSLALVCFFVLFRMSRYIFKRSEFNEFISDNVDKYNSKLVLTGSSPYALDKVYEIFVPTFKCDVDLQAISKYKTRYINTNEITGYYHNVSYNNGVGNGLSAPIYRKKDVSLYNTQMKYVLTHRQDYE